MPADVLQRTYLAVLSANDDERLAAEFGSEKIAGRTHLALVSGAMPMTQDEPPCLALEELRIAVELAAERMTGALGGDRRGTAIGGPRRDRRPRHTARVVRAHRSPLPSVPRASWR